MAFACQDLLKVHAHAVMLGLGSCSPQGEGVHNNLSISTLPDCIGCWLATCIHGLDQLPDAPCHWQPSHPLLPNARPVGPLGRCRCIPSLLGHLRLS